MALGIVKVLCNPRTTWTPFDVEELPSVGIRFFVAFFFLETKSRNVFCFVVFVLLVMNSTAEILQPQMNTRRLLVRVLTLHEECDRICCEEKTKMLPQLKSNSCIMYFLAGEKTLPIGLDAAKHPKNMLAV